MSRTPFAAAVVLLCAVFAPSGVASAQDMANRLIILNATISADGDLLTITGTSFGPAPAVTIDGQPVAILAGATDTQVTVVTPAVLLTAPGTYRLTVVDSVRQIGEVFVVASRAEPVPAVSFTANGTSSASAAAVTIVQPRATGAAAATPDGARGASPVGTFAIEDPGTPFRTALGFQALAANTSGSDNTGIGYQALLANTTAGGNTAIGASALHDNTGGSENTAVGAHALQANTGGIWNTATGAGALFANTGGGRNTAAGFHALTANTTGHENTAIGADALQANTTGIWNTATGVGALFANTGNTANANTANGYYALMANIGGLGNTAVGAWALVYPREGSFNTATGAYALIENVQGHDNTANGYGALYSNRASAYLGAEYNNWEGHYNTSIGSGSLYRNGSGSYNTAIGASAGYWPGDGSYNVYLGANAAGQLNDTNTIRIGVPYVPVSDPIPHPPAIGQNRTFIAGIRGTSVAGGVPVVIDADGQLGTSSLGNTLDVSGFIRSTSLIGGGPTSGAGLELLYNSGSGGIGQVQAYDRDGASYEMLLLDGAILGLNAMSGGNVGIGMAAPEHPLQMASGAYVSAGGVWTNASSRTLKDQIADLPAGRALEAFAQLRPVTFVYKSSPGESHAGFISEDVPDLVATRDRRSLAAMDLVAVLTKVVQEQQQQLTDQQATNAELRARLARVEILLMCAAAGDK